MGSNMRIIDWIFHNQQTSISDGNVLNISAGYVTMVVSVIGNAIGFNLVFEGMANNDDDYTPIMCVNLSTLDLLSIASINGKYQISLEGLVRMRCRLSAITSGNCTVKSTVVN